MKDTSAFAIALVVAIVVTPVVRKYAVRWKLGDKPNGRRIHTDLIPHLGGIALVLGCFAGLLAAGYLNAPAPLGPAAVVAIGLIVAMGLIDDMKNLRAMQKLAVQVCSAVILALSGFNLVSGLAVIDGPIISVLFSVVFLVGISSSVNLIDGHDGLAAGVTLISATAFAFMGALVGSQTAILLAVAVGGACLGFLFFNFPPGRIYMGDTGSMFLGVMLGLIACAITALRPGFSTFVGVCFVMGVPMLDAWLAIARRATLRWPIFVADSHHMHHVLRDFGFSARQTLLVMYSMQAFLGVLGVLVMLKLVFPVIVGSLFLVVTFVSFYRVMVAARSNRGRVQTKLAGGSIQNLNNLPAQDTTTLGARVMRR